MNDEIEITTEVVTPNKNLKFLERFSWFWSVITCTYIFFVTFLPLTTNGKDFAQIVLGFLLGTAVATILGYYYGSSVEKGKIS